MQPDTPYQLDDLDDPVEGSLYGDESPPVDEIINDPMIAVGSVIGASEKTMRQVYRACFRQYPQPVICLNTKTKTIELWNDAAEVAFKIEREKAIGKPITIIFPANMMSESAHNGKIDKFSDSTRSNAVFGTRRRLTAKASDGQEFPIKITTFKIEADGLSLIGGVISDISAEEKLLEQIQTNNDQLRKSEQDLVNKNKILGDFNQNLLEAKQAAEFRMARARSQDKIANRLMVFIIGIIIATVFMSAFVRIPETILSFVKDSSLLLLGILSSAIGGIFGGSKDDKATANASVTAATPFTPTPPMPSGDTIGNSQSWETGEQSFGATDNGTDEYNVKY